MINRLPLTVGFARVSQATEDQGNLETQTRQLQDYGVHELVTEVGSGARSDRRARRDLQARLQAGDTLVVTAIDNVGLPATWAWFEHHRCAVDRCGEEPGGRSALRAFLCHDVGALCPGLLRAFPHLRYVVVVPCFDKGQRGRLPPPQWPNFCNRSDLRGSQQLVAFHERIEGPRTRQVPKREARVILLSLPAPERVPPLILRLITRCRRLRSAALLSGGVSGCDTKTNNSPYQVRGRLLI